MRFPTTGAIVGDKFYFIANADVDDLLDGKIGQTAELEPVKIAFVPLS